MKLANAPTGPQPRPRLIALAGNPNSGKTTVFNALTGLRQKVGNYPGVTVERKTGTLRVEGHPPCDVLDLPGTYSLTARSPEEQIARNVLLGEMPDTPRPDLVIVVLDASNLERNLYLAGQILDIGVPTILALNMMDVAEDLGNNVDAAEFERLIGVPVVPMVASRSVGAEELKKAIVERAPRSQVRRWKASDTVESAIADITAILRKTNALPVEACDSEAIRLLGSEGTPERIAARGGTQLADAVQAARQALQAAGTQSLTFEAENRYRWIRELTATCVRKRTEYAPTASDRADRILTHRLFGPVILLGLMALVFQTIFAWASIPMGWIDAGIVGLGEWVTNHMQEGALRSLIVDGVLGSVGAVVIFLPQILFLFFFIGLLEDTGYMARAAFMMDKLMKRIGLHGKAFIPLLSSFACAIPGIMAARTIENPKDRLVTILVAPFITCSARLPVYTLLIAAFIPGSAWMKALVMTGLYLAGVVFAIGGAFVLKRTVLRSETPPLILELPPYKLPHWKSIVLNMWDRSRMFLQRAGTIILGIGILLWFLASYPQSKQVREEFGAKRAEIRQNAPEDRQEELLATLDAEEAGAQLRSSFAGRLGRFIEPAIRPLGWDWKIGIALISSFAAREVFVGTMGTIYSVGDVGDDVTPLAQRLQEAKWDAGPQVGQPVFTMPAVIALFVFYILALHCMSTVATMIREMNSWKWPLFGWTYMAVLAYVGAWVAGIVTSWFV